MPPIEHNSTQDSEHREQAQCTRTPRNGRPQQSISDLFKTSKQGIESTGTEESLGDFSRKKLKTKHCEREPGLTSATLRQPAQLQDMYHFSSPSSRRTPSVIDLTESPNGSPLRKRPHGVRPMSSMPQTGPKKLIVKGLRQTPRHDPEEYYNRVRDQLDSALSAIFTENKVPYSMEELYRGVEILCKRDRASELYKQLCEKCNQNIRSRIRGPLIELSKTNASAVNFLEAVVQAWSMWKKQLETIRAIFFFLDRSYLLHSVLLPSIDEMGTSEFRLHVFSAPDLGSKILQGACDVVGDDRRKGEDTLHQPLLQDSTKMFHSLSVYSKNFEPVMLAQSQQFYLAWTKSEISSRDLAGYVQVCGELLKRELRRCDIYGLDETTRKGLESYLEDILVDQQQARLLVNEDVGELLAKSSSDTLAELFSLLQRRRLGEKIRPAFEAYIITQGSEIVFDEEREQEMVMRLLEFKRKLDSIWCYSFQKHEQLGHGLREAFETFINKSKKSSMTWGTDNPKPGEMIAKYVDMVLKQGIKAIPTSDSGSSQRGIPKTADEEDQEGPSTDEDALITRQLDQVLDLFRFVHGKAVFEAFYKRDLARRLLLSKSASFDAEKSMLTRLKSECGAGFTHNLEQMFKDIEMAREEMDSYKDMLKESQTRSAIDLNVNVLSASAWPSYPKIIVNVPESILKAITNFEQHYKMKHTGRRLEWKHALAHCQLNAKFPRGAKEIVVSCFQAVILMSFNENETLSYAELQDASGLDGTELKRTLQSLACAQYRVLSKTPRGKDVNPEDSFAINMSFSHAKYRIKINQIQAKETKAENKETHERVAADRNYETQAAIVRIMKGRKTITHAELVSEVITATKSRGVLDPADIKKNIEKLIEKDYMERDEEGHNVYNYVA